VCNKIPKNLEEYSKLTLFIVFHGLRNRQLDTILVAEVSLHHNDVMSAQSPVHKRSVHKGSDAAGPINQNDVTPFRRGECTPGNEKSCETKQLCTERYSRGDSKRNTMQSHCLSSN
jgi:hypothetical protein